MACASCGGGKALTPNRPIPMYQSPQPIRVASPVSQSQSSGFAVNTNPNKAQTKRTKV